MTSFLSESDKTSDDDDDDDDLILQLISLKSNPW